MKKALLLMFVLVINLSACAPANRGGSFRLTAQAGGFGASEVPSETPLPASTATFTPIPASATPVPLPSASPTLISFPIVTFAQNGICRSGPALRYYRTGQVNAAGKSYQANGRTDDGTWISVQSPSIGDYCWVQVSTLATPGDLSALKVVQVQPLPDSPINLVASDHACGIKNQWLHWYAVYDMGYHIYRNGKAIDTVYQGEYQDHGTPHTDKPTAMTYSVEAFNASGVSIPNTVEVTICD